MYGFGDDRNPANDTINVMEKILVEYIADVVCITGVCFHRSLLTLILFNISVRLLRNQDVKTDFRLRTCEKLFLVLQMQKKLAHMEELLFAQEDIRRAKQQFKTDPKMA